MPRIVPLLTAGLLSLMFVSGTALPASALDERALCTTYKTIYTGGKTVDGHGSEVIVLTQLGSLGVGRGYLPGPGLVTQAQANTACQAACTLGINGKECLSLAVYHKCLKNQGSNPDPFIHCGATTATGGFWYCDFYTEKLTTAEFQDGDSQGGNLYSSTGFVKNC